MQHEDRERFINIILARLKKDLRKNAKHKIIQNPYEPYNSNVILDLMANYSIQRRTAKEWLICAQIKLVNESNHKL